MDRGAPARRLRVRARAVCYAARMVGQRRIGRVLAAPRRGIAAFFGGLVHPFRGAKLVYLEHLDLIRYWIVPIVATLVALSLSFWAVFAYEDALTSSLWSEPTGEGWAASLARAAHWLFEALIVVLLSLAALAGTLLVSGIVAAPFNARLAEVIDERITGAAPPPFTLARAAGDVARALVIETTFFAVNAFLVIVSLVFPVVSPVTGPVGLLAAALYFGITYVETPQATRGRGLRDRLRLVTRHPMAMLGFGTGVGLFLFVPLVNLLFMPAAVAGGVLFHAALEADSTPPRDDA
jgi:CysZ protein